MQVSVDTAEGLKRSLKIAVPAQKVEQEVQSRLQDLARTVRMSGFRPGKIPYKVVEKRYGGRVRQEVLGEVLQSSFQEAVDQENLSPATGPQIEPLCIEPGKDLEYRADFEVYPDVKLKDIKELDIVVPDATLTDEDMEKAVDNLRKGQAQWLDVERAATDGDQVIIDYSGSIDGEEFAGGTAEDVTVTLGAGQFLADFERHLSGVTAGQDIQFELSFPDDYAGKDVAGKTAQFTAHVHKVQEVKYPELNDDFAKNLGVEEGLDKLKSLVRSQLEGKLAGSLREERRQIVMKAMFEANPVDLPEGLVRQDSEQLLQETLSRQKSFNQPGDAAELMAEDFTDQSKRRVALSMILGEVVKQNQLEADPERIKELVYAVAQNAPNPGEVVRYYYSDKRRMSEIQSIALEDKVVEWVLGRANVRTETKNYEELTG